MKRLLFLILLLTAAASANAQDADAKTANEKFMNRNFADALEDYLELLEKEPKNEKYNYRVAVCYLNTNINKAKAIPYLEIVTRMAKYEPDALYLLGRAYQFGYRFDDAIKTFTKFKQDGKGKPENLKDAEIQIQYCYNAKELMKFPLDVTFENLGKNINTPYADYFPFVPADESFLLVNSRRPEINEEKQSDGSYSAKIYISKVKDGSFSKAKNIGSPVNPKSGDAEVVGLSSSGDVMLIYYNNYTNVDDIYISYGDKNNNFDKPENVGDNVNSLNGSEIAAAISPDGNTLYFASDRNGGSGGTDLYVCKKLPSGKWGEAVNLGKEINTDMNEDFPSISPDGKTLYFSSGGHTSMGGYDIFKAEWDEASQKWVNVKNLGYPINTPDDNYNFRISKKGRYGYIAATMDKGMGDLDIYRVTFNEVEPDYSILKGFVLAADSSKYNNYGDVFISVTDVKSGELIGNYIPNPSSGKYVIILAPGKYQLSVEVTAAGSYEQSIEVLDKSSFKPEINRDIIVKPK
jgi:hypothetical protein